MKTMDSGRQREDEERVVKLALKLYAFIRRKTITNYRKLLTHWSSVEEMMKLLTEYEAGEAGQLLMMWFNYRSFAERLTFKQVILASFKKNFQ